MAMPHDMSQLDSSESEEDRELSRISVMVGARLIDVGLPSGVSISAVVNDVIELANVQLRMQSDHHAEFDNTEGKWTFAHLTGETIDPDRSLAEAGVHDGELLVVQEIGAPASSLLVDELESTTGSVKNSQDRLTQTMRSAVWFVISIALSAVAVLSLAQVANGTAAAAVSLTALAVLLVGFGTAAAACVMPYRSGGSRTSAWLGATALPLIFGGSLYVVPGGYGVKALPMALALTALVAVLQLLLSGRGRALYTAVIGIAVIGAPAVVVQLVLNANPRAVGALVASVALIVVYLAPRVTIALSRLPVPRVPTAGEPLDDIETQGGTAVEGVKAIGKQVIPNEQGMSDRVRRASEYLTGIVAAAAILTIVGCYGAIDVTNGFFWPGVAFAFVVAAVLCLRGRSHHDLIQSAVLIGGGVVIALIVITKTVVSVDGWQVNAAIALVALTALLILCGLVAPRVEFSPVMRRWVEIGEYVAIGLVFPLACWIIRLYAFFRELRV
jgi:ESX secretion system protein EccD